MRASDLWRAYLGAIAIKTEREADVAAVVIGDARLV
jgi:hypothetical protein